MAKLIGTDPNQVPTNADLGTMAYQDAERPLLGQTTVKSAGTALIVERTGDASNLQFKSDGQNVGHIYGFKNGSGGNIAFYPTNSSGALTQRMIINRDGNVTINDGNLVLASGHGIDFSATGNSSGTTDSEILYDYEEGSWNPVVYDTNTSGHVLTLNNVIGRYKKIGNWVNCTLQVGRNDATSLSGVITLTNLPFTVAAQGSVTGGTFWLDKTSSDRIGVIYVVPSADRFYLLSDHAVDNYLLMSEWQNARPIYIQVSYNAA